jgi:hypothetical protein
LNEVRLLPDSGNGNRTGNGGSSEVTFNRASSTVAALVSSEDEEDAKMDVGMTLAAKSDSVVGRSLTNFETFCTCTR